MTDQPQDKPKNPNHGGKRTGSGRKTIDKRIHTVRLTPTEKNIIDAFRNKDNISL